MPYLIDTDCVIDYLAADSQALALLESLADQGIAISVVTHMEIYEGVERSPSPVQAQKHISAFLESVPTLHLSPAVARRCARLRQTLRSQGRRVNSRALDLIIAATAIEHDLTLVTHNLDDYRDIPGLKLHQRPVGDDEPPDAINPGRN